MVPARMAPRVLAIASGFRAQSYMRRSYDCYPRRESPCHQPHRESPSPPESGNRPALRGWGIAAPIRVEQLARAIDVASHLLDKRLRRVEAPVAAQALEKLEAQLAAVEVAVEVEHVGLDELTPAGL